MLLALLLARCLASPQSELLRLMDEADADPVVAISCQPVAPLTRLLDTIDLPGFNPREAPEGSWMSLLTPSRLASAGIDAGGSVSVLFFDDRQLIVDIDFDGSERQASAVVAALLGLGPATLQTFGWRDGRLLVGGRRLPGNLVDITLRDGRLTLRAGMPSAGGRSELREVVRRADPGAGCAMTFDGPLPLGARTRPAGTPPPHVTGIVHLPLVDGEPATVRFVTADPVPTALTADPGPPIGGSTSDRPAVLAAIGVSLGDLLLDPALRGPLRIEERDVVDLLSRVRFGRGTTVALFADAGGLGFVANVDATRADGRPVGPRRARRAIQGLLGRLGLPTARVSGTELVVRLERSTVWLATRPGGLVLGSDRIRVAEVARGAGAPWIGPEFAALAAAHPVALRSDGVATRAIPPVAADLGVRTQEGLWELQLGVHVERERREATHSALAATMAAMVLPHILPADEGADGVPAN